MSKQGNEYLDDEITRIIDYSRKEFDMTYAEVVGLLIFKAHMLISEAFNKDQEDE